MSSQSCDPFGDPSHEDDVHPVDPDLLVEMSQIGVHIERRVHVTEPIVRDFNRRMRDTFGACPSSPDGTWATIDSAGALVVSLDIDDIFRLSTGLERIARLVEADDLRRAAAIRRGGREHLDGAIPHPREGTTLHPPTSSDLRGNESENFGPRNTDPKNTDPKEDK